MSHEFSLAIVVHLVAAFAALGLGSLVFRRRKGGDAHRWMGRAWVLLMGVTAVSTYWIRTNGGFSWIHGLSVFSLLALSYGVWLAISGKIRAHRKVMSGVYFGALVIAGAFTLLPSRLLGQMLWGSLGLV